MAKSSGRAKISVNGQFIDTFKGVTLDPGGIVRTPQETAFNVHYTESSKASKLEIDHAFNAGNSLKDLDVTDAVVTIEWDTGQTHVIHGAFRTDPTTLGDEGKAKTVLQGNPAEEII